MDNYVDELKNRIAVLYQRIEKASDTLLAFHLIKKSKDSYQYVFSLPSIINRNMQLGNYKRAAKYYFLAKKLMDDVDRKMPEIKTAITTYMLNTSRSNM